MAYPCGLKQCSLCQRSGVKELEPKGSNMKTLVPCVFGAILSGALIGGWDYWRKIPSIDQTTPSPHTKQFIDSMVAAKGWRIGREPNCIVNERAKIVVTFSKDKCHFPSLTPVAEVSVWSSGLPGKEILWESFSASDLYWIGRAYGQARQKLEMYPLLHETEELPATVITAVNREKLHGIRDFSGVEMLHSPTHQQPSEDAKGIIASMLNNDGWRLGEKGANCIVNEIASLVVLPNGEVKPWSSRTFSKYDQYWIQRAFDVTYTKLKK
jgi:hypothetical protein